MKSRRALQVFLLVFGILAALGACNNSAFYTALGNKIEVPKLVISPATATVPANGSTTFSASGGVPPYAFSITSGPGSIVATTGVYTAPAAPGVAIVQVKDKQGTTATAVVNPVTYAVTVVNNTGLLFAGGTASGTFTIKNQGSSNGTQTISWSVYASPTPTLGSGSTVIQSLTTVALGSGASVTVPFTGTWPITPNSYYLIASISSPDSAGASLASAVTYSVVAAVDYAVSTLNFSSVATTPGGAVSGTFTIHNNGPDAGTQPVTWQVYADTTPTLTGAPVLLASNTTPFLGPGGTSPVISFNGTWPAGVGYYYLVVKVSVLVDQDQNLANNIMPVFDAALTDPTNAAFATATSMGITLAPLMTLQVMGTLSDLDDFLTFNAGTATNVTFTMTWTTSATMTLTVLAPPGPPGTTDVTVTATGTSMSTAWPVGASAGQLRYLHLNTTGVPGIYVLTITAS